MDTHIFERKYACALYTVQTGVICQNRFNDVNSLGDAIQKEL